MLVSSSAWLTTFLVLSTFFTLGCSQRCGGSIEAGAGVIRSTNYPDGYPASDCVWIIDSGAENRIRLKFQVRDCSGDSLWIYDGNGTVGVPRLGQYCSTVPPTSIDSSGRLVTIKFMSVGGAENNQGFVISYESIDLALGSRVIWSEIEASTGSVRLNSVPADPTVMLKPDGTVQDTIVTDFYFMAPSGNWTALETRYGEHELIWSDGLRKVMIKGSMGSNRSAKIYYGFTSSSVLGVAVDWLTGNVYWTDAAYDWIIMHDANGTRNVLIIDEGLDIPTGIAIHPSRGYLFWTDSGSRPKVERSNLAGGGRLQLVSTNIVRPSGITVDYETDLVYWVDSDPSYNHMEVCNLEGANRRTLMDSPTNLGLFDLTISGNYIYTTAKEAQKLIVLVKDSGQELFNLGLQYTPYSIVTYAPDVQPQGYSPCSSNPCSFLCVGGGPSGYSCLCGNGFLLKEDGRTCEKAGTIDPPQYFVASRSKLCRYPINFPDIAFPIVSNFNVSCFLEGRSHAVAIAVDLEDGIVFFSDLGIKGIGMATLRDGAPVKIITGGVRAVQGLAVDWMTKHLYWTDHARGTIEVSKYDGSYRTTLIKDNVIKPRSIAIDPERKYIFWTEFGPPTQIERASLDGTERVVIMTAPHGLPFFVPTGLAIDTEEQRLYYADLSTRTINKVDYFGNNKRQLLRKNGAIFFDVALYKDYILWTELGGNNGIYASNRHTGEIELVYHNRGEQVYGITTYADTRQKIMHHPCRYQNGGCDQLCLSSSSSRRGFVCVCTLGFYLADDGKSCVSDLVRDNFFLVTDTYRRAIFQVDMQSTTFEPKALFLPSIQNPIAVSFDPIDRKVYWTDVTSKTLSRASLDGNDYQVIARDGIEVPDGIAVDSISRLVYWTDYGTHGISVSHLDGSNRKMLIRGLEKPRALVLHPVEGTMFWTDWGDNAVIERAFMDGTERSIIVSGSLVWPNGLTIDYDGNRLYWCDAGLERLETADFNGRDRRLLFTFGRNVHAYDVAVRGQFLYWTDWTMQSVLKMDKDTGSGIATVGPNDYLRPNGIYMVSDDTLPSGDNQCSIDNGGCTGLCLPVGFDRNCTCADGFQFDEEGTTCVPDQVTECPRVFHNGFVDESCDPRPGHVCDVQCHPGFSPSSDAIICQASGTWDLDVSRICMAVQCRRLETPPQALPGPCSPPYNTGKMCTYSCIAGYTKIGGDDRSMCDEHGEWIGIPIRCERDSGTRIVSSCNPDLAFLEEPQNLEVADGDLLELRCRVSDQDATLTWVKDGTRLDSGAVNGIYVDQLNQLLIPSFDERHAGHYACAVFSGDRECMRSEASITFNPLSYFEIVPLNAYVNISEDHRFQCSPKEHTGSVVWEKDGRPLVEGNLLIRRGYLYLTNIREENEGKYTCVARDQFGRTKGRVHAWLYLTDPPQIDITTVCGTITYWKESKAQTTPSPVVVTHTEAPDIDGASIDWSSSARNEADRGAGRVVGGNTAKNGSAPYMVRIWEYRTENAWDPWTFICGATLLDQRWILTAAHCMFDKHENLIQKENMNLFFGDYDSFLTEETERSRQPAEIIVHEDYDKTYFDNDIALIRIDPPLWEFTPYIRPICLAPEVLASRIMETNINGRVTGWGQESVGSSTSRYMKEVNLPIVDRQTCEDSIDENEGEFTDNMFCAGYHSAQHDACEGDSGGPFAFRHDDGRWYQLGIVSWGVGCAAVGEYGFYTHVSRYLHWLRSKNVTVAYSPNVARRFNESQPSEALSFTVRSPSNLTVAAGSVVDLECSPNRDDASVQWFINNRPVRNLVEGVRFLPSGLVLHFDAVEDRFSGVLYSCEARVNDEDGEQVIRANFQLQVTAA
ncbi:uncharacterized protein LOC115919137 isoform X2 [Strongylocentrotus purpuratus]|uniref:Uncharacterized protein n=1 Tax=Strongylocentrotus purpuratus TaxID=7668 RepID=A0A7M7MZ68_STRPU|nr:uncharacterized protein LOC115919137 isoform X2 [Strongylocentrotus purpuratus]